mmetsp:Transcript_29568/g.74382  ORF Transcript_29568/g.74382 Transcript_29568/m.74382 type:complete len:298 (-) Transcript_29568:185-1078(-)
MGIERDFRASWKERKPAKPYNEEEFQRFLNRQAQHLQAKKQRARKAGFMDTLCQAPLLPIQSMVYMMQGGSYRDKPGSAGAYATRKPISKEDPRLHSPSWHKFLGRQEATTQRAQIRCQSAPPERRSIKMDAEREAEFLQRQAEVLEHRKESLQAIEKEMVSETILSTDFAKRQHDRSRRQSKEWLLKHGPKGSREMNEKAVQEAQKRWKKDYVYGIGESPILPNKQVNPDEAIAFYERVKAFPCISNRVPPQKPPPYESTGMKVSGNPYEGGKADKLRQKLGDRACVGRLPASLSD